MNKNFVIKVATIFGHLLLCRNKDVIIDLDNDITKQTYKQKSDCKSLMITFNFVK